MVAARRTTRCYSSGRSPGGGRGDAPSVCANMGGVASPTRIRSRDEISRRREEPTMINPARSGQRGSHERVAEGHRRV